MCRQNLDYKVHLNKKKTAFLPHGSLENDR